MDRKKTILITAAVNAGLLILLFVVAMVREEEHPYGVKGRNYDAPSTLAENNRPLFCEPQELPLASPVQEQVFAPLPTPTPAPQESVHQLPAIVQQKEPLVQVPVPAVAQPKTLEVCVKKGDTLEKIAKMHQTSVNELLQLNHLSSNFLRIGQVLKVPAASNAPAVLKPKVEKQINDGQAEYYVVKVGDNPWTIAMKHHMKIDELLKLNQMNEEKARRLKPGDRLRIR